MGGRHRHPEGFRRALTIIGISLSHAEVAGALAMVGGAALVAAPLSGKLADRYGHRPVMLVALLLFGLGLLPPLFIPDLTLDPYFLAGVLPIAFAAVVLMTLPYSVLMGLLSEEHHGAAAGMYGLDPQLPVFPRFVRAP